MAIDEEDVIDQADLWSEWDAWQAGTKPLPGDWHDRFARSTTVSSEVRTLRHQYPQLSLREAIAVVDDIGPVAIFEAAAVRVWMERQVWREQDTERRQALVQRWAPARAKKTTTAREQERLIEDAFNRLPPSARALTATALAPRIKRSDPRIDRSVVTVSRKLRRIKKS